MRRPKKRLRPSAKIKTKRRKLPQNSPPVSRGISVELGSSQKTANRALTTFEETRGRKRRIHAENVVRAANDLLKILEVCSDQIDWGKLEIAKTEEEAASAFERVPSPDRERLKFVAGRYPRVGARREVPEDELGTKDAPLGGFSCSGRILDPPAL